MSLKADSTDAQCLNTLKNKINSLTDEQKEELKLRIIEKMCLSWLKPYEIVNLIL